MNHEAEPKAAAAARAANMARQSAIQASSRSSPTAMISFSDEHCELDTCLHNKYYFVFVYSYM